MIIMKIELSLSSTLNFIAAAEFNQDYPANSAPADSILILERQTITCRDASLHRYISTNRGSCVPEIRQLLQSNTIPSSAA